MSKGNIVRQFSEKVIAFHPVYAHLSKSVLAGLFLSQAAYWSSKKEDGWFYKSQDEWTSETYLTRYEQEAARKVLKKLGVLEEKKEGLPYRLYFKIDFEALAKIIDGSSFNTPVCGATTDWSEVPPQTNIEVRADLIPKSTTESTNKDPYNPQGDVSVVQEEFSLIPPSQATPVQDPLAGFAEFYKAYPNKKARPHAERAYFKALKVTTHDDIMAGLAAAKGSTDWAESNGKYIPHPATWLNAAGWEDDYRPYTGGIQVINGNGPPPPPPKPEPRGRRWQVDPMFGDLNYEGSPNFYADCARFDNPEHRLANGWHKDQAGRWDRERWLKENEAKGPPA